MDQRWFVERCYHRLRRHSALNRWPFKNTTTRKDKAKLLFLARANARRFTRVNAQSSRIDMEALPERHFTRFIWS
jgi:hypothetical protein